MEKLFFEMINVKKRNKVLQYFKMLFYGSLNCFMLAKYNKLYIIQHKMYSDIPYNYKKFIQYGFYLNIHKKEMRL